VRSFLRVERRLEGDDYSRAISIGRKKRGNKGRKEGEKGVNCYLFEIGAGPAPEKEATGAISRYRKGGEERETIDEGKKWLIPE